MNAARWSMIVFGLFGIAGILPAADAGGDLALRARAILKKNCAECHTSGAGGKGTLIIMDAAQLLKKDRPVAFVKPKVASGSQIVEFIEDGSMPPGDKPKLTPEDAATVRAWIDGGAPIFPRQFDESFVDSMILADIEAAKETDRKFYRYFTLHHLVDEGPGLVDLSKQREAFRKALNSVSKKELETVKAVDPTESIFRVDLREIGWDVNSFRVMQAGKPPQETAFSVFDFLMIEYPFGEMPPATPDAEKLAELWLRPNAMFRPVVATHAEWFTKAVDGTPLKTDIGRLTGNGGGARPRGFNAPDKKGIDLRPDDLPNIVLRPLSKTIPIVPIDAWYLGDYEPKPPAPKLDIVIMSADGKPASQFKPGDRLKMEIRSTETVFVELLRIDAEGSIFVHDLGGGNRVLKDVAKDVDFEGDKKGLPIGDVLGKQRFIVFAATEKYPAGELIQSKHEELPIERFIHRFYEMPKKLGDPLRFDASKMVRKTAFVEVKK